jgi:hypothetical protein
LPLYGVLDTGCSRIYWEDKTIWCRGLKAGDGACASIPSGGRYPDPLGIKKVYILFSNHLDVGYTLNTNGSCAGAVVNEYFADHFPRAIALAKAFRDMPNASLTGRTYRWMTQVR